MPFSEPPPLPVTVFSDYVCPFCYVADRRLWKLRQRFDLEVTWRPLEIHPGTPPEGMPVERLGYSPDLWQKMMMHLGNMAAEEGIRLAKRQFTTNSHNALLLSEAAKELGEEAFYQMHTGLFRAFLSEGRNIGDPDVLADVALEAGMDRERFERVLIEPEYEERLRGNFVQARRLGITGVPAFVIGDHLVSGAVPLSSLIAVAEEAVTANG